MSSGGWFGKGLETAKLDAELVPLTQSAYRAEMQGRWSEAYDLHMRAEEEWRAFAKSAKTLSGQQRVYKQVSETRCMLHQNRLEALRPFAKEGEPVPDELAMHPSLELAAAGVSHLVAPDQLANIAAEGRTALSAALHADESSYTSTLPVGVPATEYEMRCDVQSSGLLPGTLCHIVLTWRDVKTKTILLVLESWARPLRKNEQYPGMQEALVYRPADHPTPAFRIQPLHRKNFENAPRTCHTTVFGISGGLNDVLDRPNRSFSCRRFGWDGHYFVRKPLDTKGVYLSVHEFFKCTPKPGSKTGKRDDDALPTRLFWVEDSGNPITRKKWKVYAAAGLHPLLREYMAAIQLMGLAIVKVGATPAPAPEERPSDGEVAGWIAARSVLITLLAVAVGGS